jgi:hypothetical protein
LGSNVRYRNTDYRNGLAESLIGRVCTVGIFSGLIILFNGFLNISYGEVGHEISDYHHRAIENIYAAKETSSDATELVNTPSGHSNQKNHNYSATDTEEVVYLVVYLNGKLLTEVLEAKERGGLVYVRLNKMTHLFESAPPEDPNAVASSEALEKIFPAKFEYSQRLQALIITGEGKLPVEKKWAREYNRKMMGGSTNMADTPLVEFEYGLIGPPSLDISANYQKNGHESFNYSFKAGMEALYGTASVFGRGLNEDELTDLRVKWERLNRNWFVEVGDVYSPPIELVARSEAGRGFNFSTFPIENSTQFDTDTIAGDLLVGWEVELYRGNTLLDFRTGDASGRFIFRDIPLLFGKNNIILKFYGPQGQLRQESQPINIGRGMTPEGKLWTRLSFTETGRNLFLGRNSQTRVNVEGPRGLAEVFYGLSKRFTLTGSLSTFKNSSGEKIAFGKVGFLSSVLGSSLKFDFLTDDNDGSGLQYSFLTQIAEWGIQYNHVEFFDLKTDLEPNLKSSRTLRLNKGFKRVFLELSAEQKVDKFDVTRYIYGGRVSGNVGSAFLTSDIQANFGGGTEFTRGNLLANGWIHPKMMLRGGLNYEVNPEVEVRSVRGTLDYRPSEDMTLRLNVVKNMIGLKDFVVSPSVLWNGKKVGLGITGSYSTDRDFLVTASVTFSLSPNASGGYGMSRNPSTNMGTVNVRVFLDHDQDGKYDSEKDELLKNVRLKNYSDESGDNGMIAFKAPAYRLAKLKIDENTLPDPFMVIPPAVSVRPRPTHINTMNMAVWETGEIEGQAEPGELVELIKDGKVIDSTHAEFDGFFLFEKVLFKVYEVRTGQQRQRVLVNREQSIARVKWNGEYQVAIK